MFFLCVVEMLTPIIAVVLMFCFSAFVIAVTPSLVQSISGDILQKYGVPDNTTILKMMLLSQRIHRIVHHAQRKTISHPHRNISISAP